MTIPGDATLVVTGKVTLGASETLAPTGPVKVAGEVALAGNATIGSGTLDLSAATLTIAAGATPPVVSFGNATTVKAIDAKGSLTLGGTSAVTVNDTATFGGAATFNTSATFEGTAEFKAGATVSGGKTLTVDDDAALTVTGGTVTVAATGNLTVSGEINVVKAAKIDVSGTYTLTDGEASGTNYGTVTVASGGTILSYAPIAGDGENIVEAGGQVAFGKSGANPVYAISANGSSGLFKLTTGKFIYGNEFYELEGAVEVINDTLIDMAREVLTLRSGAVLTIPSGKTFRIKSRDVARPLVGASGAKVVLAASDSNLLIDRYQAAGNNNFYSTSNVLLGSNFESEWTKITGNNTFNWDVDAGGSSVAGWKQQ
jgi:lipopolysaccharide export system protein LptA